LEKREVGEKGGWRKERLEKREVGENYNETGKAMHVGHAEVQI
jgi:hypothetical protein